MKPRISSFLRIYEDRPRKETVIFSVLTRRILKFNSPLVLLKNDLQKDKEQQRKFLKLGLLTTTNSYQKEILDYLKLKEDLNRKKITAFFTITTNCDLRCKYCFENHLKRTDTKREYILRFVDLLDKKLEKDKKIEEVKICLFGGEPLLRIDFCCLLLAALKKICMKHGARYLFSMASNGLLAEEKEMDLLKKSGLTEVQITFDGCGFSHDEIRKREKRGTYDKLLKKIILWGKIFDLTLKYNLRKQNVTDFEDFVRDIKNLGLKKVKIKLEALQPTLTETGQSFCFDPKASQLAMAYLKLAKISLKRGIPVDISSAFKPPCMVSAENSFMIEPDGDVSACVSAYKMERFFLGNIRTERGLTFNRGKIINDILKAAGVWCIPQKCPYFPICETGCLFMKQVLKLGMDIPYCRRSYFDRLVPGLIRLNEKKT